MARDIAKVALEARLERRRAEYLTSVSLPLTSIQAICDLSTLTVIAENTVDTDPIRDEAEKLLLRLIGDPEIAAAFYEARKYFS